MSVLLSRTKRLRLQDTFLILFIRIRVKSLTRSVQKRTGLTRYPSLNWIRDSRHVVALKCRAFSLNQQILTLSNSNFKRFFLLL